MAHSELRAVIVSCQVPHTRDALYSHKLLSDMYVDLPKHLTLD